MEVVTLSFKYYGEENREYNNWSRFYWDYKRQDKSNNDIYDSVRKNSHDIQRILKKLGLENALEEE